MANKIESWRLWCPKDDKNAWNGELTVTFDRHDLNLIVAAVRDAYYEGCISEQDMNYIFDKLNIDDN